LDWIGQKNQSTEAAVQFSNRARIADQSRSGHSITGYDRRLKIGEDSNSIDRGIMNRRSNLIHHSDISRFSN
jgi:hypothetical protein